MLQAEKRNPRRREPPPPPPVGEARSLRFAGLRPEGRALASADAAAYRAAGGLRYAMTEPGRWWYPVPALADAAIVAAGFGLAGPRILLPDEHTPGAVLTPEADAALVEELRRWAETPGDLRGAEVDARIGELLAPLRRLELPPLDLDLAKGSRLRGLTAEWQVEVLADRLEALGAALRAEELGTPELWYSGGSGLHLHLGIPRDCPGAADLLRAVLPAVQRAARAAGLPLLSDYRRKANRPEVTLDDTLFAKTPQGRQGVWWLRGALRPGRTRPKVQIPEGRELLGEPAPIALEALRALVVLRHRKNRDTRDVRRREKILGAKPHGLADAARERSEAASDAGSFDRHAPPGDQGGILSWPRVPTCRCCGGNRCRESLDGSRGYCYRTGASDRPGRVVHYAPRYAPSPTADAAVVPGDPPLGRRAVQRAYHTRSDLEGTPASVRSALRRLASCGLGSVRAECGGPPEDRHEPEEFYRRALVCEEWRACPTCAARLWERAESLREALFAERLAAGHTRGEMAITLLVADVGETDADPHGPAAGQVAKLLERWGDLNARRGMVGQTVLVATYSGLLPTATMPRPALLVAEPILGAGITSVSARRLGLHVAAQTYLPPRDAARQAGKLAMLLPALFEDADEAATLLDLTHGRRLIRCTGGMRAAEHMDGADMAEAELRLGIATRDAGEDREEPACPKCGGTHGSDPWVRAALHVEGAPPVPLARDMELWEPRLTRGGNAVAAILTPQTCPLAPDPELSAEDEPEDAVPRQEDLPAMRSRLATLWPSGPWTPRARFSSRQQRRYPFERLV